MVRQPHMEGRVGVGVGVGRCKIRKRRSPSSSSSSSFSSSSLPHKYRFKRPILVAKRGGSTTPAPTWKRSPSSADAAAAARRKQPSLSARKLAATLWEINDLKGMRNQKEFRSKERVSRSAAHLLPPHLLDPPHTPFSEIVDRSRGRAHRRRRSAVSRKLQMTEYNLGGLDSLSTASVMEIETQSRGRTHSGCIVGAKSRLKDVSNSLATSKELLKVLNRIWGLEEMNSSSIPVVSALLLELDRARNQVDQLIREQRSNCEEINHLMKHFAEEKAAWKSRERARIREAIASVAGELEVEKKLRRQTERLNKKLGEELGHNKASLSKAVKELKGEKRAREILEQMCDELARGIGEDRVEVEELKRESAKVREEVEKEREMLQLADVLREERVQMKLSEAKYQFEEKNAAVDKLRHELESYLRGQNCDSDSPNHNIVREDLEDCLRRALMGLCEDKDEGGLVENAEECGADDSGESDLHSIELNMDNCSKGYMWSYDIALDDSKRIGRKPATSLGRVTSNGIIIEWDFDNRSEEGSDVFDKGRTPEHDSEARRKDYEDEIKRYKSVKGLRDHILSGSSVAEAIQGLASPTQKWEQASPLQEYCSSAVVQGRVVRVTGTRGERQQPVAHSTQ